MSFGPTESQASDSSIVICKLVSVAYTSGPLDYLNRPGLASEGKQILLQEHTAHREIVLTLVLQCKDACARIYVCAALQTYVCFELAVDLSSLGLLPSGPTTYVVCPLLGQAEKLNVQKTIPEVASGLDVDSLRIGYYLTQQLYS